MATLLQRIGLAGGGFVLLVALVANALLGVGAVRDLVSASEATVAAQRAFRRLTVLQYALSDAETGQRGFLLTGEESYLEPYTAATRLVTITLDSLDAFAAPGTSLHGRMPTVRGLTTAKLDEMGETVMLMRAGRRAAALALVGTDRGQRTMESLRAEVSVLEAEAQALRDRQVDLTTASARRATRTLVFSNAALLLLAGLFGWWLRKTIRQREAASADVRRANASLGQALAEREAALTNVHAMQAQMVQQEKLAGLGRLTAGVAHELKNPLNFVNNFAQLADEMSGELQTAFDTGDTDEARALLPDLRLNTAKIIEHGRRADEIVRTMLVHARGVSGERQAVALDAVLAQAAQQAIGPADTRPVEIVRRGDTGGVEAWGVPSALTRLFLNLIDNAVQAVRERAGHAPDGDDFAPTVWLGVERGLDRMGRGVAVVTVEDNGPGIAEASLPRIFEPFYTTKAPGQGTGLGLSLAYDIAIGHGGTLAAARGAGGGALFTVTLPLGAPAETNGSDGAAATRDATVS